MISEATSVSRMIGPLASAKVGLAHMQARSLADGAGVGRWTGPFLAQVHRLRRRWRRTV
jgi:hypothetical protein